MPLALAADVEKRWTVFSTVWFTMVELKYFLIPPAIRFLWFIACREVMSKVYEAHKALVLWREYNWDPCSSVISSACWSAIYGAVSGVPKWKGSLSRFRATNDEVNFLIVTECKLDAYVAGKGSEGRTQTFSKAMALRRLHWKNCAVGEALYMLNIFKVWTEVGRTRLYWISAEQDGPDYTHNTGWHTSYCTLAHSFMFFSLTDFLFAPFHFPLPDRTNLSPPSSQEARSKTNVLLAILRHSRVFLMP